MSGYVFPCKTNGNCRKELMEAYDIRIPFYVTHGTKRIFGVKFKCCTQCHLPVSKREADWLNKELGYSLNDIEIDSDFLDLLNGIE